MYGIPSEQRVLPLIWLSNDSDLLTTWPFSTASAIGSPPPTGLASGVRLGTALLGWQLLHLHATVLNPIAPVCLIAG